ncbi:type II toxin-antitoxin system HicB family antitoxin [Pseudomonas aeruginosa]
MYDYAIRFEQDDSASGVAVFCRDLPELNSFGDDREHAIREALDAIETTLSLYVDARKPIPEATPPEEGEHVVHLPSVTVARIALWNEMMKRGMRKSDLCKLLGIAQTQGDRLVDFLHTSKMEALESALAALDTKLTVRASYGNNVVKLRYMANTARGRVLVIPGDADPKALPRQYEWLQEAPCRIEETVDDFEVGARYAMWNVEEAVNAIQSRGYFSFWLETTSGPRSATR